MNDLNNTTCKPSYKLMNEDQIKKIHEATLDILENVGVRIDHEDGMELMNSKGCEVKDGSIVRIPRTIVEECIESARYCLKHGMPGGGYIFSTSNCIYTGMRLSRYELILEVWRKEGNYA